MSVGFIGLQTSLQSKHVSVSHYGVVSTNARTRRALLWIHNSNAYHNNSFQIVCSISQNTNAHFFDLRSNWLSIILHVEQEEGIEGLMVLSLFLQFLDIVFIPSTYSLICLAGNILVWRLSQLLPSKPVTSLAVVLYVIQVVVFSTSSGTLLSSFSSFANLLKHVISY